MTDSDSEDFYAQALSTIRLCLADEAIFNIVEETTPSRLWKKMEKIYMTKSLTNITYLERQLYNLRMKEVSKVAQHLNVFNRHICQLTNMEVKIEEEDKAISLLCSFPESWELSCLNKYEGNLGLESWLLESGASDHMCPHTNWFTSYENVNGSSMLMGNNVSCQTVGMGNMRIKMYDNTVRTLTSVRNVSHLKKILIYLGVLDSDGYKFTGEDGIFKVSKGALVVMKVEKVRNLYSLRGSTQVSEVVVASKKEE
eukprot:PITA_09961